jgi:hypothetical protein
LQQNEILPGGISIPTIFCAPNRAVDIDVSGRDAGDLQAVVGDEFVPVWHSPIKS